jgi:OmpA-OmpF porin, OOP family
MIRSRKPKACLQAAENRRVRPQIHYIIVFGMLSTMAPMFVSSAANEEVTPGVSAQKAANNPFEATTQTRDLALDANAPRYAGKAWLRADKQWNLMEEARKNDKQDKALGIAAETTSLFDAAELEAIQNRILEPARAAIEQAIENKAKRHAPRTLEQANELSSEIEQVLQEDRYAEERAAKLAAQATQTARNASQIALIAQTEPNVEDLILQWSGYFVRLQTAAGVKEPTAIVTPTSMRQLETYFAKLRDDEVRLRSELATSQAFNASLEAEIRDLDEQLGSTSNERQELLMRLEDQSRAREQFDQTLEMFGAFEANVLRQSDDIVIRLIGLRFASGSPKLSAGNSALLKKLEAAIAIYPGSKIVIEGHTDSRGSNSTNKQLSEQRAQAIANYLAGNAGLSADRLTAVGYGAEKPIANNETDEGREKNRRIDVVIKPQNGVSF